ncbi:uncharacterized protein [Pseudochaenichthys georgianus]|nr:uncharacterized protein LOC117463487 isoform X2 [Pseudochaenichthys georgianus]
MLKCPTELIVHKDNVCYFLYVAGGLLMTVTGGSVYVDVTSGQNPAYLQRLSNTLLGLMGLRHKTHVAKSVVKRKLKRLFFTESFNSLLDMMKTTLQLTQHHYKLIVRCPEKQTHLDSVNCILARRYRIYYILICGASSKHVLTLRIGNKSNKLKTYNPSNQLWLISFISKAREQRDVVYLLLDGQISSGSDKNDATNKRPPSSLTLGLSALSVVFLWMFLPHFAVFAVICLGWKVQQNLH